MDPVDFHLCYLDRLDPKSIHLRELQKDHSCTSSQEGARIRPARHHTRAHYLEGRRRQDEIAKGNRNSHILFSVLFSFFDAFPIVFSGVYEFNLGETGVSFLGVFIGIAIGIAMTITVDRLTYRKKTLARQARGDFTALPPEERLYPAMIGAVFITVGMFWFGWSSRIHVHWISSEFATVCFGIGAVGVSAPCLQYRECILVFRSPEGRVTRESKQR
jgi:hypothetical protein